MVLQARIRASAASCAACRTSLFRPFISPLSPAALTPFRPSSSPSTPQLQQPPKICRPRLYSSTKDAVSNTADLCKIQDQDASSSDAQENREEEQPWYLDEEPRRHPTLTANDLAPLPTAPEGTPPILDKLIKQLGEDLGLEDVKLLDLRTLDPPAALGPGLVMLFGTARSERHLHISGRVLQSWLRANGIRADADGVLTRRALKIQSRRQRKRAKLLGTASTTLTDDGGLVTRWISMNLGTIGSAPQEEEALESSDGSFTGFGIHQDGSGTTIVVQMLTESKRKELDLEILWTRLLARNGQPGVIQDDLEYHEANTSNREVSMFSEGASLKTFASPSQRRFFSTSPRTSSPFDGFSEVTSPTNHASASKTIDTSVGPVKYIEAQLAELDLLQKSFARLSFADAIETLEDFPDGSPSKFLRSWNDAKRLVPPEQTWTFRVWLVARGRKLGLRRFTLGHLKELHDELELNGILCSREDYLEMLQVVYLESEGSEVSLDEQSQVALQVLRTMFERGERILEADVIVPLIESLARAGQQSDKQRELQSVLEKLINQADLPFMGEGAIIRLLSAYAYQGNWDRFWEVWRMPPKHLEPRSETLYRHMWDTVAATGSQRLCRQAIRGHFYEMLNESLPVKLNAGVRRSVIQCARIADPRAEDLANNLDTNITEQRSSTAEFVRLFRLLNNKRFHEASELEGQVHPEYSTI